MKLAALFAAALVLPVAPSGQEVELDAGVWRYESGKRVRAMERAWGDAPEEARADVVETVNGAVSAFFRGGAASVAEQIDAAWLALDRHDGTITDLERAVASLTAVPDARVVPDELDRLGVQGVRLYGDHGPLDVGRFFASIGPPSASQLLLTAESGVPASFEMALDHLEPGRYEVHVGCAFEEEFVDRAAFRFEIVRDLAARLAALDEKVGRRSKLDDTIAEHTAHLVHGIVEDLADGKTLEADYPAEELLAAAELLTGDDGAAIDAWFAAPGERWLSVPLARGSAVVRVFVPEGIEAGANVPVVFGLHGAGGSENMFFESYGDGLGVELARERGWIFVAPRVGMFGSPVVELANALAERLPIDSGVVFVVGHSMGAMATVKAASADPDRFAAIAALGGGGSPTEALTAVPAFVAAGASDFGRPGVDALARFLAEHGADQFVHRTYENTEHLLIVQRALPDVFAFFDAHVPGAVEADTSDE